MAQFMSTFVLSLEYRFKSHFIIKNRIKADIKQIQTNKSKGLMNKVMIGSAFRGEVMNVVEVMM